MELKQLHPYLKKQIDAVHAKLGTPELLGGGGNKRK